MGWGSFWGAGTTKKQPQGFGPRLSIFTFKFDVHGNFNSRPQNSFFVHLEKMAKKDEVVGWCRQVSAGLWTGEVQSQNVNALMEIKEWLRTKGPPGCTINSCNFHGEGEITVKTFKTFTEKK